MQLTTLLHEADKRAGRHDGRDRVAALLLRTALKPRKHDGIPNKLRGPSRVATAGWQAGGSSNAQATQLILSTRRFWSVSCQHA